MHGGEGKAEALRERDTERQEDVPRATDGARALARSDLGFPKPASFFTLESPAHRYTSRQGTVPWQE